MTEPPLLRIDLSSPVPAYRQIAGGLRAMLVARLFRPGDVLPTIRQLAVDLGVHANTVAEAYRVLADEGWVDLRRRRGATVLRREVPEPGPDTAAAFAKRFEELAAEALTAGVSAEIVVETLRTVTAGLAQER